MHYFNASRNLLPFTGDIKVAAFSGRNGWFRVNSPIPDPKLLLTGGQLEAPIPGLL